MRFFADGPTIPDELLEQRDRGNVAFFCGAGVSTQPAHINMKGIATRIAMRFIETLRKSCR